MSLFLQKYFSLKVERDRARDRAQFLAQKLFERLCALLGFQLGSDGALGVASSTGPDTEYVVVPSGSHPQNVSCEKQRCWLSLQVIPRDQIALEPLRRDPLLHVLFSVRIEIASDWSLCVMAETTQGVGDELFRVAPDSDVVLDEQHMWKAYEAIVQVIEDDLRNFLAKGAQRGRLLNIHLHDPKDLDR